MKAQKTNIVAGTVFGVHPTPTNSNIETGPVFGGQAIPHGRLARTFPGVNQNKHGCRSFE